MNARTSLFVLGLTLASSSLSTAALAQPDAPAKKGEGAEPKPADDKASEPKPEEAKPAEEAKPEEAKPAEEAKPEEAKPAEEAKPSEEEEASLSLGYGLVIQPDLRFRFEDKAQGLDFYDRLSLPAGVERNQNLFRGKLKATYGRFRAVGQVDFVLNGFSPEVKDISGLSRVEQQTPYRFDVRDLYIEARGLLFKGLDVRIGQQVVMWGEADQFNPTNNLNPDDLRDPLLFGQQAGNFMIKADYWVTEKLSLSGVLVPLFRPALLPFTAPLGAAALDRLPFTDAAFRHRVASEQASSRLSFNVPTVVSSVNTVMPEPTFENMQAAFRIALSVAEQDVALSYYNGRTDFPQPLSNHARLDKTPRCDPKDPARCTAGTILTDVTLHYPRMHVYGFNMTGEVNPFKAIMKTATGFGYRIEAALVVPEEARMKISNDELDLEIPQDAGEYDYDDDGRPGGRQPTVVTREPFFKWTVGLDTSVGEHVYLNGMWVHGLVDEYGAGDWITPGVAVRQSTVSETIDGVPVALNPSSVLNTCALPRNGEKCIREISRPRIGDYLVLGMDLKFLNQALLLRLFAIFDLSGVDITEYDPQSGARAKKSFTIFSEEGFSGVLYPELNYNFGNGFELAAGALVLMGKPYTKFGDPAAGGSMGFMRARYSM